MGRQQNDSKVGVLVGETDGVQVVMTPESLWLVSGRTQETTGKLQELSVSVSCLLRRCHEDVLKERAFECLEMRPVREYMRELVI